MTLSKKKKYVRRGFDIELDIYNRFLAVAKFRGVKTKDLIEEAVKRVVNIYEKKQLKKS